MKIAYFVGTLIEDGVTKVLLNLAQYAIQQGHEAIIITGYIKPEIKSPVKVITVPAVRFPLYKDYRLTTPGRLRFATALKKFQPDLLHLHSPDPLSWAALNYGQRHKKPVLITHHTAFDRYLPYYHLAWLEPLVWELLGHLYNRASLVNVPSPLIAQDLKRHGIKNLAVIPWGIDLELFNPSQADMKWRQTIIDHPNQKIILYAGRLTWEKDLKTLAATYKILNKSDRKDDFKLVIAGGGPAKAELEKIMPAAIFMGHLDHACLAKVYAASDIFLFPSSTESFGLVVLEAMASGLAPVVANKGGASSLIIDNQNGLLAQALDPGDFSRQVNQLLDNPYKLNSLRQAARQTAENYSWGRTLVKIFELYQTLVNKK